MAFPLFAAFSVFSGILSGVGRARQVNAEAKAAEAQAEYADEDAAFAERNAGLAMSSALEESRHVRILGRRQLGSMRTAIGASGLTSEGFEGVIAEANAEIEMAAWNIRSQGRYQAQTYRQDAKRKRSYADQLRSGAADIRSGLPLDLAGTAVGTAATIIDRAPGQFVKPRRGA